MNPDNTTPLRQRVSASLARFEPVTCDPDSMQLRAAAVAIVVVERPEPAVLLTLRSSRLRHHAGQFALPGGRLDEGETAEMAAGRELHEELGLRLTDADQIGRLDDYVTRSGFCISSVVFYCDDASRLRPNPDEVASVYFVPFSELESDAIPHFEPGESPERPVLYSHFPSVGTQVYAPTAALLYQFREVALYGKSTRIDQFDQPRFAWR